MQNFQQSRHALGAAASLTLVCPTESEANGIFEQLWRQIDTFEETFSRFRPTSELTRVNGEAGKPVAISAEFHDVLRRVLELASSSDGLYNPLILPALQRAGYKGSWPQPDVFNPELLYEKRRVALSDEIRLTDQTIELPPDTALDLGGSGKGLLLDQLAGVMGAGVRGYWFSLGGDIINEGTDAADKAWRVDIADARRAGKIIAHVPPGDGRRLAVTTSGVIKRRGVSSGRAWHHIIDPRTLRPAETDLLTVTVSGASAASAEVWAKCAIILGSVDAPKFLQDRKVDRAVLQTAQPLTEQLIEVISQ